mgnify:CR=1 FL=1
METRSGKGSTFLRVALASLAFSAFILIDKFMSIGDLLYNLGWPTPLILLGVTLVRFTLAGIAVLAVMPPILGFKRLRDWLPGCLGFDVRVALLGILSFALFALLAAGISLALGIFQGDLSLAFARPDTRPDPDVVGWGFFLLALVPGIWEELAFRGLDLSRLRDRFGTTAAVLLSAVFFGLFHLTNLATQPPAGALLGAVMAFFFGIGWAVMTIRARSVIPAMIAHYLVDSVGQVFLGVDGTNPALQFEFFLLLTLTYPLASILLARLMYRSPVSTAVVGEPHQGPGVSYDPV